MSSGPAVTCDRDGNRELLVKRKAELDTVPKCRREQSALKFVTMLMGMTQEEEADVTQEGVTGHRGTVLECLA